MSDSLRPHGLQHARLPCPSPTLGSCSNSCQLNRWCQPTISSSVIPYSSCLQSLPASGSGWRRLLRVPWTARRSNQSILKEISPGYSLEGLKLKLKPQNFGHLMWRTDSFEKTLMLGKIEGGRRKGWQRTRLLDGITDLINMNLSKLWEIVRDREAWCSVVAKSWIWLNDWTTKASHTWRPWKIRGPTKFV